MDYYHVAYSALCELLNRQHIACFTSTIIPRTLRLEFTRSMLGRANVLSLRKMAKLYIQNIISLSAPHPFSFHFSETPGDYLVR